MTLPFEEFDRRLREADAAWNVVVLGQALRDMMVEDPTITFVTVEKRLRELGSKTFLIAAPASKAPQGVISVFPDGTPANHWVWVALHGQAEATATLEGFGIPSASENLTRLAETGFLVQS